MTSVGIDLGGTKCLGVGLDDDGVVVSEYRLPTPHGVDAVLDTVCAVATELGPARFVGVGVPGIVDRMGVLQFAPNLPGVVSLPLRAALQERLDTDRVTVDNDGTYAAWAERQLGAARGADHAVLVTVGTGIGGGAIVGGRLDRGANGFAGEFGSMIVDPQGPRCTCGRRGCWETCASGSALGRMGREAARSGRGARLVELAYDDPELVRGEHVSRACGEGDEAALALMAEFARWLALGLTSLMYVYDPEVFVLGGGLLAVGDVVLVPTRAAFAELVAGTHRPEVPIVAAQLGERAGAIGAALVARGR